MGVARSTVATVATVVADNTDNTDDTYNADNGQLVKIYDEAQISALLDALYADCVKGNMAQSWAFHEDAGTSKYIRELTLYTDMTAGMRARYLNLYSNAKNTLSVLSTLPQGEK